MEACSISLKRLISRMAIIVLLLLTIWHATCLSLGRDLLKELMPGPTQYLILLSNVGGNSRGQIKDELSPKNRELVDSLLKEHPNPQPELGERFYDGLNVDVVLSKLYQYEKTLDMRLLPGNNEDKNSVLNKIWERFNDTNYQNTILYFSGHTDSFSAAWKISEPKGNSSEDKWNSVIVYRDITNIWSKRADVIGCRMLLLIIEASYSGFWSKRCYEKSDFEDVAIMAAAEVNQIAYDMGFGGYMTYNLMEAARPFGGPAIFIEEEKVHQRQNISSMGVSVLMEMLLDARLFYANWTEIFQNGDKNPPELW